MSSQEGSAYTGPAPWACGQPSVDHGGPFPVGQGSGHIWLCLSVHGLEVSTEQLGWSHARLPSLVRLSNT